MLKFPNLKDSNLTYCFTFCARVCKVFFLKKWRVLSCLDRDIPDHHIMKDHVFLVRGFKFWQDIKNDYQYTGFNINNTDRKNLEEQHAA